MARPRRCRRCSTRYRPGAKLAAPGRRPERLRKDFDPLARQQRQMHEIDRHSQWLLEESPYVRKEFMTNLDCSSMEKYQQTRRVVPRRTSMTRSSAVSSTICCRRMLASRKVYDEPKWTGYEVVMDVFPDVIAYGVLCCRKTSGRARSVRSWCASTDWRAARKTRSRATAGRTTISPRRLAEQGLITFAPQNLYLFSDRFRTLQRKANPLKKTLFSIIVPQHQQIVDWLASLPQVDPQRIAFYGLSYGGKTAMRVPPLVTNYCMSICSADFNRVGVEERLDARTVQLRLDRRIRDFRVRSGQHLQLRRDGRPDRAAAVDGRARALRRRRAGRGRGA